MGRLDKKALNDNFQEQYRLRQQVIELQELIQQLRQAARIVEDSEKELNQAMDKLHDFLKTKETDADS